MGIYLYLSTGVRTYRADGSWPVKILQTYPVKRQVDKFSGSTGPAPSENLNCPKCFKCLHYTEQHGDRSLIVIRWDPEERFWIWGLLNSGTRWVARIDRGRLQSSAALNRLIVHISGPGNF